VTPAELFESVVEQRPASIAKAISLAERGSADSEILFNRLFDVPFHSQVIGITGPPGAGKSTLVDRLIEHARGAGQRVAVLAVDPSSPISGGSILGDRVRMQRHALDQGVFIRSLSNRGHLGGLSEVAYQCIRILEAAKFDWILVESIGIGQNEIEITRMVDTTALVTIPGMGDYVQAMKAGVMEFGDILVINKSDLPGVGQLEKLLLEIAHDRAGPNDWTPPVVKITASNGEGIEPLVEKIRAHYAYAPEHAVRRRYERQLLDEMLQRAILNRFYQPLIKTADYQTLTQDIIERKRPLQDLWSVVK
jgi:LAO/AO transport system kinase